MAATPLGKASAVYLLAVDKDLLIEHRAFTGPTTYGPWSYQSSYATVSSKGELYMKGFDGNIYTKLFDSASAPTLVSGL